MKTVFKLICAFGLLTALTNCAPRRTVIVEGPARPSTVVVARPAPYVVVRHPRRTHVVYRRVY